MGRKIPAKKHRGVKDPLAQQAKRWQSIKGKINAPPKDPDEQPVPRSLIRLFNLEDPKAKDNEKKKKRKINNNSPKGLPANKNAQNPVSQLRRLPGESGRSFSLRINGAIRALNGSAEELHYPSDNEEGDMKGDRMEDHRRRRERKRKRNQKGAASQEDGDGAAKLTRGQKLTLKKKAKKLKENEKTESQEVVYERVGFGEVAHAPPTLRYNKKNKTIDGAPRPGRRDLLLTKMLTPTPSRSAAASLPPAELLRRERARQAAVDAYRALKAEQHAQKALKRS